MGSKRSKQTQLICQTRGSNRDLFDIIKPRTILLLHGSLVSGKSQISLSLDVITYTWVDSPHTSLCMKSECQTFVWSFDNLKTYNESTKENLSYLEVWGMFFSDIISEPNTVKIGHTARESRVLGSKSNFSPGVSL